MSKHLQSSFPDHLTLAKLNYGLLCKTNPTKYRTETVTELCFFPAHQNIIRRLRHNGKTAADWRLLAINQNPSFPLFSYLNKL